MVGGDKRPPRLLKVTNMTIQSFVAAAAARSVSIIKRDRYRPLQFFSLQLHLLVSFFILYQGNVWSCKHSNNA